MIICLKTEDDVKAFVFDNDCIYVDDCGVKFTGEELNELIHNSTYDYDTFIGSYVVRG